MPKVDEIYKLMEAQNTPYIRIFTMNRERIMTFEEEGATVESTIQQMKQFMPMLQPYGKVLIHAGSDKIKKGNFATPFIWTCVLDPVAMNGADEKTPWGFKVPPGYVHQDTVAMQLQMINQRFDHEKELRLLNEKINDKAKDDPIGMLEKFGPLLLLAMGKTPAEIQQIGSVYKGGISGPQTAAQGTTLTFSDVKDLPQEEKQKRLNTSWDELSKHISLEHMILLVEGLTKKLKADPQAINMILQFI